MQIITSSFFTNLPNHVAPISIARWAPKSARTIPTLRALCPGRWFRSATTEEYRERYLRQLDLLDPVTVVQEIEALSAGRTAALLCWERPHDGCFCHRGYVSVWFSETLGLVVPEFGRENDGTGWSHPKLPARYLRTPETTTSDRSS